MKSAGNLERIVRAAVYLKRVRKGHWMDPVKLHRDWHYERIGKLKYYFICKS